MRKHAASVRQKIREDVVDVTSALKDVAEQDVQIGRQMPDVHAKLSKADVRLMIEVIVQSLFFAQTFNVFAEIESIQLFEQSLLVDFASDFLAKINVVGVRGDRHRLEQTANILAQGWR